MGKIWKQKVHSTPTACPEKPAVFGEGTAQMVYSKEGGFAVRTCKPEKRISQNTMAKYPSNRGSESFMEFALMLILLTIVMLAILLIVGDNVREFFNDIGIRWSLIGGEGLLLPLYSYWLR